MNDFWIDGYTCSGSEAEIFDCEFAAWGAEDCSNGECVNVQCGYRNYL